MENGLNGSREQHPAGVLHAPSMSWQAISFAFVGLSGTAISFLLLTMLHKGLGWQIVLANPIAYVAGIANNYVWNRLWTFRHVQRRNVLQQGGQFALVSLVGLLLHTATLSLLVYFGLHFVLSFGAATMVAFAWNFYVNHKITFRHQPPADLHAIAHPHLGLPHTDHNAIILPGDAD